MQQFEPENFRQFLIQCVRGNQKAALQILDLRPGLLNERLEAMPFSIGNENYIVRGSTPVLGAIRSGNDNLAVELLKRGADVEVRDSQGRNGMFVASVYSRLSIASILLDRGCDPNSKSKHWTALGIAAAYDRLPMCILLLSKGADLYADMPNGVGNALQHYGEFAKPPLSPAVLEERLALLQHAYDEGPHPNARWARRWPFMQVMVFNDFQPLLARQLILLTLNPPLPPDASIPPVVISTAAQRRAFLNMSVFGHEGIWRIIASYI